LGLVPTQQIFFCRRQQGELQALLRVQVLGVWTTASSDPARMLAVAVSLAAAAVVTSPHLRRRDVLFQTLLVAAPGVLPLSGPRCASAAVDCMQDCTSNCNRVAPRSTRYCESSCVEYCAADDRRDGLSGSVSSEGAEIGWASGFDPGRLIPGSAPKPVVYGDDRPPALPDVFNLAPTLRKVVTGGSVPSGKGRWSVEGQGGVE